MSDQWAQHQVQAWFDDGWLQLPRTVGDKLGTLLGAAPGQVVVAGETTSTTLFNAMLAACRLRDERPVLLVEAGSFPTDLYIAGSVARLLDRRLVVKSGETFDAFLDEHGSEVAAAVASPVDFRTGARREIGPTTARCHASGAVSVWDLSHAAGVLPTELDEHGVDLAVGCGYKYLGGGPGAPAFLYVAERLQSTVDLPLCGWHGHSDPFEMAEDFVPARDIDRGRTGTPPLLSVAALNHALDPLVQAGIVALHQPQPRPRRLLLGVPRGALPRPGIAARLTARLRSPGRASDAADTRCRRGRAETGRTRGDRGLSPAGAAAARVRAAVRDVWAGLAGGPRARRRDEGIAMTQTSEYVSYAHMNELHELQQPRSDARGELNFILISHVKELLFRAVTDDLDIARSALERDDVPGRVRSAGARDSHAAGPRGLLGVDERHVGRRVRRVPGCARQRVGRAVVRVPDLGVRHGQPAFRPGASRRARTATR